MKKQAPITIDAHLTQELARYCHLRGLPLEEFVNHVLSDAIEPYQEWVDAFERMKRRRRRSGARQ